MHARHYSLVSSLVNTLPITKKNKHAVVTEAPKTPGAPRDQSQHPRARNDYDEETAYDIYMNPEPGFQSGPGDSANAD